MKTCDVQTEAWRAPVAPTGSVIVFDEPGRVLDRKAEGGHTNVCYRSHHLRVVKEEFACGDYTLLVKHGGGTERWRLSREAVEALQLLDSDHRYFTLYALMRAHQDSARDAAANTERTYRQAFVDGRLKKRKNRGQASARVWIEARVPG